MAKRQHESDKKRKAQEKRVRRDLRKQQPDADDSSSAAEQLNLNPDEVEVLETFAKYLMPAEQMLCLSNSDIPATKRALEQLIGRGLLTANTFKGGFSLTIEGVSTMQKLFSSRKA